MDKEKAWKEYQEKGISDKISWIFQTGYVRGYAARDNETCEWQWDNSSSGWMTSCSHWHDHEVNTARKYCTYCGKKIKEKII